MQASNVPGTYCSLRNSNRRNTCHVAPVVATMTRERVRDGVVQTVTYYLCEYHARTAKRADGG